EKREAGDTDGQRQQAEQHRDGHASPEPLGHPPELQIEMHPRAPALPRIVWTPAAGLCKWTRCGSVRPCYAKRLKSGLRFSMKAAKASAASGERRRSRNNASSCAIRP